MSKVAKFADDTKLDGKVICTEDCNIIQNDLNKLIDWSEKWLMSFNIDKCKVMHIEDKNPNFKYKSVIRTKTCWKEYRDERQNLFLHCVICHEERLKQLDMFTLHKRKFRGDMIEVFKILNKFDKINPETLFEINNASVTRGNGMKLKIQRYNTIAHKSYFNLLTIETDSQHQ